MMKLYAAILFFALGFAVTGCTRDQGAAHAPAYESQLVRSAGATVEDAKVYLVQNGHKRWIVHGSWISAHGYAWPKDVHVISRDELAKIPGGEPITEKL